MMTDGGPTEHDTTTTSCTTTNPNHNNTMISSDLNVHIKQELDHASCCSPSPSTMQSGSHTTTSSEKSFQKTEYKPLQQQQQQQTSGIGASPSPGSPDRQCSSTTSGIGDISCDSINQSTIKEELPR